MESAFDRRVTSVFPPAPRDGSPRPAAYAILDGARLCRRGDVVVVTLNHRLNAFGHLYLARLRGD